MRFAREAWPFVLPIAALAAILSWISPAGGAAALLLAVLVLLFFRDPMRRYHGPAGVVIAPADGKIMEVSVVEDPEIGPGRFQRIVTFLSVFDVHVQQCPVEGEVVHSQLRRGLKLAAFKPEVGDKNEAWTQVLVRDDGQRIGVRQLAGLIARRVVSYLAVGDRKRRGEALGVIKFGSRVDLFVPESYRVLVARGDRVACGATPMATPPAEGA
ncbi:MAG: phosphatidylserine decarboxylase [Thermoanaerobaculia bacterium]